MLNGIKIVSSPLLGPVPKIQLSPDFNAVSPEFKRDFNAWLRDRFGTESMAYVLPSGTLIVDPRTAWRLRGLEP